MMVKRRRREGVRLKTKTTLRTLMKRSWGIWGTKGAKKKIKGWERQRRTKSFTLLWVKKRTKDKRFLKTLPRRSYLMSSDSLSDIREL